MTILTAAGPLAAEETVDFARDVRPIFNRHCVACHGGVKQASGLSFVYRDQVLGRGNSDRVIVVPGQPGESELVRRIMTDDTGERMPPVDEHPEGLSPDEIAMLVRWVEQGAEWSGHWSFVPPRPQPLPPVIDEAWCMNGIDHFVLARLEQEAIEPAKDAKAEEWLRRVSLDLIGLPPTPDEREAFLADIETSGDAAYEHVVDRLLMSPQFGERWASVWLDQVRYADSRGLGQDGRRNIWKYRDWVIDAFNRDLPYDEFTIEQIAGDLLPDANIETRLATAVHRLTQQNEEGGTDDEEFRVLAVLDRINTLWQTWQGLTFGCTQCHSHPYEPFRHEEYYRFAAFFNNTADCDLDEEWPVVEVPLDPSDYAVASRLDERIAVLQEAIWDREIELVCDAPWRPLRLAEVKSSNDTKIAIEPHDEHDEFHTVGTVTQNTDFTIVAPLPDNLETLTAIRFTGMPLNPQKAVADSEWGFVLSHLKARLVSDKGVRNECHCRTREIDAIGVSLGRMHTLWKADCNPPNCLRFPFSTCDSAIRVRNLFGAEKVPDTFILKLVHVIGDEPHPFLDPRDSLGERSRFGFAAYGRIHYPREAAFVLDEPVAVPSGARLEFELLHRVELLGAFSLVTRRGQLAVTDDPRFQSLAGDLELMDCKSRLSGLETQRSQIESTPTPVLAERPRHLARPSHVFERGNFLTKGPEVVPGVPDSLPSPPFSSSDPQPTDLLSEKGHRHPTIHRNAALSVAGPGASPPFQTAAQPDRLALAHWLVSPDNPLSARVAVNRFWARLFGTGLVETEEDFGSSGEPPSHPELLDYLALRFQNEHDWSVKGLLREIVLSRTYGQNSRVRPELYERDPQNRLLATGPRVRLPAEMIRDQALAVSGLLSEKMFGPPVHPPIPDGVWKPFQAGDRWRTAEVGDADRYRRSIYTYTKRTIPYPMFAAFDAPSREFCTPRRLRSNTPLQALMTLNDEALLECARALSGRMQAEGGGETNEQLAYGYLLTTGTNCDDTRRAELKRLYDESLAHFRDGAEKSKELADTPEEAAMTVVASVLFNLDEVVMK